MKRMHIAESAINRLLNLHDDLNEPAAVDTLSQGQQLDAALQTPVAPVAGQGPLADGLVTKGLGLAPVGNPS
ncbi:MAG: hypothetical protein ABI640_21850 [Gammaproteobacteria bacterium]